MSVHVLLVDALEPVLDGGVGSESASSLTLLGVLAEEPVLGQS